MLPFLVSVGCPFWLVWAALLVVVGFVIRVMSPLIELRIMKSG